MQTKTLNDYKENIFSQYGEDGIVKEILRRLNISEGVCVEFGAWDGVLLSNTANLWTKGKWKGVLIEAGKERVEVLKKVIADYDCIPCNDFVTPLGEKSTESILKREKINFDDVKVLSIDIDGNEYHILNGLTTLHPALIIAEYNPTIPPEMDIVSVEDAFFGSSAKATTRLMESKGYILVAMTNSNCFFVDKKFSSSFSDLNISFEALFDRTWLTYLITAQDGAYAFSQSPAYGMGLPLNRNLIETGKLFFTNHSHRKIKWIFFKDSLKNFLGIERVNSFKSFLRYISWFLKGKPIPAHEKYKIKVLKQYAKKYKLDTFIATGTTSGGAIVIELSKYFKKLYTVESDPTLYHQAKALAYDLKNIIFKEGDSMSFVEETLKQVDEPVLFWFDSHYPHFDKGGIYTPVDTNILQELQCIFRHKDKKHVAIIDDVREFTGKNGYPELSEIKKVVEQYATGYKVSHNNDLLVIEPI